MTYKIQIDEIVRDATAEEAAVIDAVKIADKIAAQAAADKAAARQAVIDKLGLTADEVTALLS